MKLQISNSERLVFPRPFEKKLKLLILLLPLVTAGEAELKTLMDRMESDVLLLAGEVEQAYKEKCADAVAICANASYSSCLSEVPRPSCMGGDTWESSLCTDHETCSALYDFTVSSLNIAASIPVRNDVNPTDNMAKEAICYSLKVEPYMVKKFKYDKKFWVKYDVDPPQSFFGSESGIFRIHPAHPGYICGAYDPRVRPWYNAATSGPKDVLLLLDTSGSMARLGRLKIMKEAAKEVVHRLTFGDHVAVIQFNSGAESILHHTMMQATEENKELLMDAIDQMNAGGSTNFLAAFERAYDVLERSRDMEFTSDCHQAVLFLTDGVMTDPDNVTAADVINLISERSKKFFEGGNRHHLFLYSFGAEANRGDASAVPRSIACEMGGIWSHIEDGGDLVSAMGSYYKYFAYGLGDKENEGFVTWVNPYVFAGSGFFGTTVAAPVYDRSVTPHVLLGAAALDFKSKAMNRALGSETGSEEIVKKLVERSTALCPKMTLTECDIQSFRFAAGGRQSLCPNQCEKFSSITPQLCDAKTNYPANFFVNTGNKGRTQKERVCCTKGEERGEGQLTLEEIQSNSCVSGIFPNNTPSDNIVTKVTKAFGDYQSVPWSKRNAAVIALSVVVASFIVVEVVMFIRKKREERRNFYASRSEQENTSSQLQQRQTQEAVSISITTSVDDTVVNATPVMGEQLRQESLWRESTPSGQQNGDLPAVIESPTRMGNDQTTLEINSSQTKTRYVCQR